MTPKLDPTPRHNMSHRACTEPKWFLRRYVHRPWVCRGCGTLLVAELGGWGGEMWWVMRPL